MVKKNIQVVRLHKNAGVGATVLGVVGFAGWCVVEALVKKKKSL